LSVFSNRCMVGYELAVSVMTWQNDQVNISFSFSFSFLLGYIGMHGILARVRVSIVYK